MRRLNALALILLLNALAATASARTTDEYRYGFDQTWRSAVRLLAVDLHYSIVDRDDEIGYVLFEYQESGHAHRGSMELVRTEGPNATPQVRVVVSLHDQPTYVERVIIDRLRRKLTEDYGGQPPTRGSAPPAPTPEPPADDDEEEPPAAD